MAGKVRTDPLPEVILKKVRLPWSAFTGIFAFFLIIILVIVALADGTSIKQLDWSFWRVGLQGPAILIYILAIYPVLKRVGNKAIESVLPLTALDKNEVEKLISRYYWPRRSGELISILLGVAAVILLSQPWRGTLTNIDWYLYATEIILFSMLALLIYYSLRNTRFFTKINKNINVDIFDIEALAPIARWSLSISLAFIGGIIISIIFQNVENLKHWQTIVIYAILVGTAVVVFFVSMWSTHRAIAKIKNNEFSIVRKQYIDACRKLKQNINGDKQENNAGLHYEVAAWGLYERRIREVKEWPINAGIVGRLVLSIVSPGVVYLIKVLSGFSTGF